MFGWVEVAAHAAPVSADEVVLAALTRDPALTRAEAEVEAALGAQRLARGLRSDPTVDARLGFGLTQHELGISQALSVTGAGLADARSAQAAVGAATATRERRRLEVAAAARRLLILTITADAEVERTEEVARLTTDLRTAAEARLASGEVAALDVHLARLEEAAAAAERVAARRVALALRETLAATTGLTVTQELPDDPASAVPAPAAPGARTDRDAAVLGLQATESALRRERAEGLPPIELGVWAQVQNVDTVAGVDGVEVAPFSWSRNAAFSVGPSVSLTVPVWAGNREGVARAAGDRRVAEAELSSVSSRIEAELAGNEARRSAVAAVAETAPPASEARAALEDVATAAAAGELGRAEAALLRSRILETWGRGAGARAEAALMTVELALAEAWPTLVPDAS